MSCKGVRGYKIVICMVTWYLLYIGAMFLFLIVSKCSYRHEVCREKEVISVQLGEVRRDSAKVVGEESRDERDLYE